MFRGQQSENGDRVRRSPVRRDIKPAYRDPHIVPGHGRICDAADVAYYRDMVTIIRDRIQHWIQKGMTLEQIKAAKPTLDYDRRYGTTPGSTDMFVDSVYKSLMAKK